MLSSMMLKESSERRSQVSFGGALAKKASCRSISGSANCREADIRT
ncbi:MAG: hypothetical protein OJF48_001708 [Afipia sp.]|nr:MAG: hypothetical protein OJF48_001708 [Afipia sp.]